MKNLLLTLLFLLLAFGSQAQRNEQTCHFGITFEISNNPNWGYGEPIVLTVEPNSPAAVAGIMAGDIIMEINGAATYLRDYPTISSWLFDNTSEMAVFTIRNLNSYFKEVQLPRRCRPVNAIDESNLATSFNMYSLEDTQERAFSLPLTIKTNKKVDYSDYHTFNFMQEENVPEVDYFIYAELEKALTDRGMVRTDDNPDMLIQTYYSYQPNRNFNPSRKGQVSNTSWRYDVNSQKMVSLPILSNYNAGIELEGQFVLELGIRFFDKKLIDEENLTQIWEANIKEYLSSQYTLEEYSRLHLPLIMMQFPYSVDKTLSKYTVSFKRYSYTGLNFDMDEMNRIVSVDFNSPAYKAGLRAGMYLEKINKIKFNFTKNEILNGYKRFIVETMKYRNPSSRFTDANGYPDCMYWSVGSYNRIAKSFNNTDLYVPVFSYLYNFEKYVSGNSNRSVVFETERAKYTVVPEIKKEIVLRAL